MERNPCLLPAPGPSDTSGAGEQPCPTSSPRASPRAAGARGYAASQGQPPRQREAPAPAQRGTDLQVTFTLVTALAAYPLPVQPPAAVTPPGSRGNLRRGGAFHTDAAVTCGIAWLRAQGLKK